MRLPAIGDLGAFTGFPEYGFKIPDKDLQAIQAGPRTDHGLSYIAGGEVNVCIWLQAYNKLLCPGTAVACA